MDNLTSWNTTLTQSKTLRSISGDTRVTYQVTSEGGGGVVSAAAGALLYPLLRARIQRLAPSLRARVLSCVAAAALALPAVLVILCLSLLLDGEKILSGDQA